jgi:hypothetical protein
MYSDAYLTLCFCFGFLYEFVWNISNQIILFALILKVITSICNETKTKTTKLRKKRSTQLLRECWFFLTKLMTCQNLQNKLLNITVSFIWYLLASLKKMSLAKHGELYFILVLKFTLYRIHFFSGSIIFVVQTKDQITYKPCIVLVGWMRICQTPNQKCISEL